MKSWVFMLILPVLLVIPAVSQEIITAERYLEMVGALWLNQGL